MYATRYIPIHQVRAMVRRAKIKAIVTTLINEGVFS